MQVGKSTQKNNDGFAQQAREENPVVFMDFSSRGGVRLPSGVVTVPRYLGRLYFELRRDIAPVACANFMGLIVGHKGYAKDGTPYKYKGTKVHRIVKDVLFQGGDLLGENGRCSRSIYDGKPFKDENFTLRHTGPGCLSMCNTGPDSNGSLYQVTFTSNRDMDDRYVVFGCLCDADSFETLYVINSFGTAWGETTEELYISDCGVAFAS
jgi:cyclophilin family peptidyl-prolyl cis-trans isomerase